MVYNEKHMSELHVDDVGVVGTTRHVPIAFAPKTCHCLPVVYVRYSIVQSPLFMLARETRLEHGNMPVLTTPKRILALHCFRGGYTPWAIFGK